MPGSHDPILRNVLENYKSEIVLQLNANTTFLTTLARHKFIPPEDIIKYEVNHHAMPRRISMKNNNRSITMLFSFLRK